MKELSLSAILEELYIVAYTDSILGQKNDKERANHVEQLVRAWAVSKLPKKKETKQCEDCANYYQMLEHGCNCEKNGENVGFNRYHDLAKKALEEGR